MKIFEWTTVAVGALGALKIQKEISFAAGAMVGAELVAAGVESFIKDAYSISATEKEVAELAVSFLSVKIVLCYVLFGLGFLAQWRLWPEEIKAVDEYEGLARLPARMQYALPPLSRIEAG